MAMARSNRVRQITTGDDTPCLSSPGADHLHRVRGLMIVFDARWFGTGSLADSVSYR